MNSAEECRAALQKLAGRLSEMSADERDNYFGDRSMSVTMPDLGITYATTLGAGNDPVREVGPDEPPADIRLTANSDEVVALAESPMNIARSWVAGRGTGNRDTGAQGTAARDTGAQGRDTGAQGIAAQDAGSRRSAARDT